MSHEKLRPAVTTPTIKRMVTEYEKTVRQSLLNTHTRDDVKTAFWCGLLLALPVGVLIGTWWS